MSNASSRPTLKSPLKPPLQQEVISQLDNYRATIVAEMVEHAGLPVLPRKHENLSQIGDLFASEAYLNRTMQQLNDVEKIVLAFFQTHTQQNNSTHGRISFNRLQRHLSVIVPNEFTWPSGNRRARGVTPNYAKKKSNPRLEDVLAGLARKGLVFSESPQAAGNTVLDWPPGDVVVLSVAFRSYLNTLDLPTLPTRDDFSPKFVVLGSAQQFQRNLIRLMRFVRRRGTLRLTTQGVFYKQDLREIGDEMSFYVDTGTGKKETDNGRFYFLRRMLPTVGLASQPYGWEETLTGVDSSDWLQLSLAERVKKCFLAWRDEKMWHELAQLRSYEGGINQNMMVPGQLQDVRTAVLDFLPQLNGTGWLSIGDLAEDMQQEAYGFLFAQRQFSRYYGWGGRGENHPYVGRNNTYNANFKNIKDEADGWQKVEADLINHIIAGPLFWMGLVDLGYDQEPPGDRMGNQPISFYRLTEYGAWLLNGKALPTAVDNQNGSLLVQPNFEITLIGSLGEETFMNLEMFSTVTQEQEYTSTFKLTKQTVYDASKDGWSVPKIIDYLENLSQNPLPQNVRRSLEEWGVLQERVVIRQGLRLVDTADESVADEIAANPAFAAWRRVTPTVFLTADPTHEALAALDEARWLPLSTRSEDDPALNSITVSPEGVVRFTQPTPSIFAKQIVQTFSAEAEHGRVLTPALVKAAVAQSSLEKLLTSLQQLNKGPLHPALIVRLKSWSDYYGPASLSTLTLVEFSSPKIRDEMLYDPEVGAYLSDFPAKGRALAVVHPEHIEAVKEVLHGRGITLADDLNPTN